MTSMLDALTSIALEKYSQAFEAAGFSVLEDFYALNPNDLEKLLGEVGMLKGHTFKLKKLIEDAKVGIVPKVKPVSAPGVGGGYMGGSGVNGMSSMSGMSSMGGMSSMSGMSNMNTMSSMSTMNPMSSVSGMGNMNAMNSVNNMNSMGNYSNMNSVNASNSLGAGNNMNSMGGMMNSNNLTGMNSMNSSSGIANLQSKLASNQLAYGQKEPIKPAEVNYEKDLTDKSNMVKNQLKSFQTSKDSLVGSLRQLMEIDLDEYFKILSQLKSMQDSIRSILQSDIEMAN